jgi:hypothetical protein
MSDPPSSEDPALLGEAMKLLLQVAWANDHLHPKERELLVKLAAAWRVGPLLEALFADLDRGAPLPPPNVALVRRRADKVMRAAEALVAADGEVDTEEDALLAELRTLLAIA